ncbi:hypothetical protein ELG83_36070 [Rhizobium leguminosarum]|nr:hypothetical protein ELG92_36020 [Rhizobium leguminosarum]TBF23606.1 hypothetical protein ELG88_35430 [Rhizobium leguminosarum]TBF45417.1 hypothetical protein ELG87_35635 [Rhizobium leguminosarum]TBF47200.1 hypothetical protein ELG91_28885 [Rhizobium leguminosarum]TBF64385.1 hypothetical protein ELG89_35890 [Rhizobium leguminosarum]
MPACCRRNEEAEAAHEKARLKRVQNELTGHIDCLAAVIRFLPRRQLQVPENPPDHRFPDTQWRVAPLPELGVEPDVMPRFRPSNPSRTSSGVLRSLSVRPPFSSVSVAAQGPATLEMRMS